VSFAAAHDATAAAQAAGSEELSRRRAAFVFINWGEAEGRSTTRTAAAVEGIEMLKRGSRATKYSHASSAQPMLFKLSEDESELTWEHVGAARLWVGRGSSRLSWRVSLMGRLKCSERSVRISDALELLVGQESEVFRRQRASSSATSGAAAVSKREYLSLSLVMRASLPSKPSELDDAAEYPEGISDRQTIDVSCETPEQFGLWVRPFHLR